MEIGKRVSSLNNFTLSWVSWPLSISAVVAPGRIIHWTEWWWSLGLVLRVDAFVARINHADHWPAIDFGNPLAMRKWNSFLLAEWKSNYNSIRVMTFVIFHTIATHTVKSYVGDAENRPTGDGQCSCHHPLRQKLAKIDNWIIILVVHFPISLGRGEESSDRAALGLVNPLKSRRGLSTKW